ncbi:hypothetical protein LINPERHAP1_LOCUS36316 [Linum perenne]
MKAQRSFGNGFGNLICLQRLSTFFGVFAGMHSQLKQDYSEEDVEIHQSV